MIAPSVQSLVDLLVRAEHETKPPLKVAGGQLWRASEIGYCLRRQYLRAKGIEPLMGFDDRTLRIFEVGRDTEMRFARTFGSLGILIDREVELIDPDFRLGCRLDFLVGGEVQEYDGDSSAISAARAALVNAYGDELPVIAIELKSMSSQAFWRAKKGNGVVAMPHQRLQLAAARFVEERQHVLGCDVDRWEVYSVSKDDLTVAETGITRTDVLTVQERLDKLNQAWGTGVAPSCECDGWWAKKCPYGDGSGDTCCSLSLAKSA